MRKKTVYASKLENERVNIVRDKERVLRSVIDEEELTQRYGKRAS